MDIIVKYIDELLEKSTPEAPMWNIEKIKQGLKSKWNYIDGCMIKAVLQMYAISKDEKYLKWGSQKCDFFQKKLIIYLKFMHIYFNMYKFHYIYNSFYKLFTCLCISHMLKYPL